MKKSAVYYGLGAAIVIVHIVFLALHRWVGEHLEAASSQGQGVGRWWAVGGLAFLMVFATTAMIAFRAFGTWPKLFDYLYLFGNAILSAVLLDTSTLLDVAGIRSQMLQLRLTFVSTVIFEGGFVWFLLVLSSSIARARWSAPLANRTEDDASVLRRFVAAFSAGREQISGSTK